MDSYSQSSNSISTYHNNYIVNEDRNLPKPPDNASVSQKANYIAQLIEQGNIAQAQEYFQKNTVGSREQADILLELGSINSAKLLSGDFPTYTTADLLSQLDLADVLGILQEIKSLHKDDTEQVNQIIFSMQSSNPELVTKIFIEMEDAEAAELLFSMPPDKAGDILNEIANKDIDKAATIFKAINDIGKNSESLYDQNKPASILARIGLKNPKNAADILIRLPRDDAKSLINKLITYWFDMSINIALNLSNTSKGTALIAETLFDVAPEKAGKFLNKIVKKDFNKAVSIYTEAKKIEPMVPFEAPFKPVWVIDNLTKMSNDGTLHEVLRKIYEGVPEDKIVELERKINESIRTNNWDWLPEAEFVEPDVLQGNRGAYAEEGDRIFINKALSPEEKQAVYIEELGHFFDDWLFEEGDTLGDEGELFSLALRGELLDGNGDLSSAAVLARREDDTGQVDIDGVTVDVEFSENDYRGYYSRTVGDPERPTSKFYFRMKLSFKPTHRTDYDYLTNQKPWPDAPQGDYTIETDYKLKHRGWFTNSVKVAEYVRNGEGHLVRETIYNGVERVTTYYEHHEGKDIPTRRVFTTSHQADAQPSYIEYYKKGKLVSGEKFEYIQDDKLGFDAPQGNYVRITRYDYNGTDKVPVAEEILNEQGQKIRETEVDSLGNPKFRTDYEYLSADDLDFPVQEGDYIKETYYRYENGNPVKESESILRSPEDPNHHNSTPHLIRRTDFDSTEKAVRHFDYTYSFESPIESATGESIIQGQRIAYKETEFVYYPAGQKPTRASEVFYNNIGELVLRTYYGADGVTILTVQPPDGAEALKDGFTPETQAFMEVQNTAIFEGLSSDPQVAEFLDSIYNGKPVTKDQLEVFIHTIIDITHEKYGIKAPMPKLIHEPSDGNASYFPHSNSINIPPDTFKNFNDNPQFIPEFINSVVHEMTHAYQEDLMNRFKSGVILRPEEREIAILADFGTNLWKNDKSFYIRTWHEKHAFQAGNAMTDMFVKHINAQYDTNYSTFQRFISEENRLRHADVIIGKKITPNNIPFSLPASHLGFPILEYFVGADSTLMSYKEEKGWYVIEFDHGLPLNTYFVLDEHNNLLYKDRDTEEFLSYTQQLGDLENGVHLPVNTETGRAYNHYYVDGDNILYAMDGEWVDPNQDLGAWKQLGKYDHFVAGTRFSAEYEGEKLTRSTKIVPGSPESSWESVVSESDDYKTVTTTYGDGRVVTWHYILVGNGADKTETLHRKEIKETKKVPGSPESSWKSVVSESDGKKTVTTTYGDGRVVTSHYILVENGADKTETLYRQEIKDSNNKVRTILFDSKGRKEFEFEGDDRSKSKRLTSYEYDISKNELEVQPDVDLDSYTRVTIKSRDPESNELIIKTTELRGADDELLQFSTYDPDGSLIATNLVGGKQNSRVHIFTETENDRVIQTEIRYVYDDPNDPFAQRIVYRNVYELIGDPPQRMIKYRVTYDENRVRNQVITYDSNGGESVQSYSTETYKGRQYEVETVIDDQNNTKTEVWRHQDGPIEELGDVFRTVEYSGIDGMPVLEYQGENEAEATWKKEYQYSEDGRGFIPPIDGQQGPFVKVTEYKYDEVNGKLILDKSTVTDGNQKPVQTTVYQPDGSYVITNIEPDTVSPLSFTTYDADGTPTTSTYFDNGYRKSATIAPITDDLLLRYKPYFEGSSDQNNIVRQYFYSPDEENPDSVGHAYLTNDKNSIEIYFNKDGTQRAIIRQQGLEGYIIENSDENGIVLEKRVFNNSGDIISHSSFVGGNETKMYYRKLSDNSNEMFMVEQINQDGSRTVRLTVELTPNSKDLVLVAPNLTQEPDPDYYWSNSLPDSDDTTVVISNPPADKNPLYVNKNELQQATYIARDYSADGKLISEALVNEQGIKIAEVTYLEGDAYHLTRYTDDGTIESQETRPPGNGVLRSGFDAEPPLFEAPNDFSRSFHIFADPSATTKEYSIFGTQKRETHFINEETGTKTIVRINRDGRFESIITTGTHPGTPPVSFSEETIYEGKGSVTIYKEDDVPKYKKIRAEGYTDVILYDNGYETIDENGNIFVKVRRIYDSGSTEYITYKNNNQVPVAITQYRDGQLYKKIDYTDTGSIRLVTDYSAGRPPWEYDYANGTPSGRLDSGTSRVAWEDLTPEQRNMTVIIHDDGSIMFPGQYSGGPITPDQNNVYYFLFRNMSNDQLIDARNELNIKAGETISVSELVSSHNRLLVPDDVNLNDLTPYLGQQISIQANGDIHLDGIAAPSDFSQRFDKKFLQKIKSYGINVSTFGLEMVKGVITGSVEDYISMYKHFRKEYSSHITKLERSMPGQKAGSLHLKNYTKAELALFKEIGIDSADEAGAAARSFYLSALKKWKHFPVDNVAKKAASAALKFKKIFTSVPFIPGIGIGLDLALGAVALTRVIKKFRSGEEVKPIDWAIGITALVGLDFFVGIVGNSRKNTKTYNYDDKEVLRARGFQYHEENGINNPASFADMDIKDLEEALIYQYLPDGYTATPEIVYLREKADGGTRYIFPVLVNPEDFFSEGELIPAGLSVIMPDQDANAVIPDYIDPTGRHRSAESVLKDYYINTRHNGDPESYSDRDRDIDNEGNKDGYYDSVTSFANAAINNLITQYRTPDTGYYNDEGVWQWYPPFEEPIIAWDYNAKRPESERGMDMYEPNNENRGWIVVANAAQFDPGRSPLINTPKIAREIELSITAGNEDVNGESFDRQFSEQYVASKGEKPEDQFWGDIWQAEFDFALAGWREMQKNALINKYQLEDFSIDVEPRFTFIVDEEGISKMVVSNLNELYPHGFPLHVDDSYKDALPEYAFFDYHVDQTHQDEERNIVSAYTFSTLISGSIMDELYDIIPAHDKRQSWGNIWEAVKEADIGLFDSSEYQRHFFLDELKKLFESFDVSVEARDGMIGDEGGNESLTREQYIQFLDALHQLSTNRTRGKSATERLEADETARQENFNNKALTPEFFNNLYGLIRNYGPNGTLNWERIKNTASLSGSNEAVLYGIFEEWIAYDQNDPAYNKLNHNEFMGFLNALYNRIPEDKKGEIEPPDARLAQIENYNVGYELPTAEQASKFAPIIENIPKSAWDQINTITNNDRAWNYEMDFERFRDINYDSDDRENGEYRAFDVSNKYGRPVDKNHLEELFRHFAGDNSTMDRDEWRNFVHYARNFKTLNAEDSKTSPADSSPDSYEGTAEKFFNGIYGGHDFTNS